MSDVKYSPGLEGVVAGETAVSTLEDGLRYRGYLIEELAEHATFEEVAHLLLHGELPSMRELQEFRERLAAGSHVAPEIIETLRKIPASASTMDVMRTGCSLLAHWDPDVGDNSRAANLRKAERLVAQLPVILAARARLVAGKEPVGPDAHRSWSANLLWMIHRLEPAPHWIKAMDVSAVLYAEHEFNASTFTGRVVASTLSDLHSCITASIGALKGPLHGGANERVLEVLQQVGKASEAERWVRDALAKKVRIMGFGHRVYKTVDPRAELIKKFCRQLADETGNLEMEQIADTLETVVKGEKKLPPNVDWPSARLYYYMNLPVSLYTPLFVVARVTGWSAHVMEQHDNNRLIRPDGIYIGKPARTFVPIEAR